MSDEYSEYVLLVSEGDWNWYKSGLDQEEKVKHLHESRPESFPCKVSSNRVWYGECLNPWGYRHRFIYKEDHTCPECDHVHKVWAQPERA